MCHKLISCFARPLPVSPLAKPRSNPGSCWNAPAIQFRNFSLCISRGLSLAALFLLFFQGSQTELFAQPTSKKNDIPKFSLAVAQFGDFPVQELYYQDARIDAKGNQVLFFSPLPISSGGRGNAVQIPLLPPVKLYTKSPESSTNGQFQPFLEVPKCQPNDQLLLILHFDERGQAAHRFIDDSPRAHPPGTVRFVNLRPNRAAFSVGGNPAVVPPNAEHIETPRPNGEGRFPFDYSFDVPGGPPSRSPTRMLSLRSQEERLLILFLTMHEDYQAESGGESSARAEGDPVPMRREYVPQAYRIYDTVPPNS